MSEIECKLISYFNTQTLQNDVVRLLNKNRILFLQIFI